MVVAPMMKLLLEVVMIKFMEMLVRIKYSPVKVTIGSILELETTILMETKVMTM